MAAITMNLSVEFDTKAEAEEFMHGLAGAFSSAKAAIQSAIAPRAPTPKAAPAVAAEPEVTEESTAEQVEKAVTKKGRTKAKPTKAKPAKEVKAVTKLEGADKPEKIDLPTLTAKLAALISKAGGMVGMNALKELDQASPGLSKLDPDRYGEAWDLFDSLTMEAA